MSGPDTADRSDAWWHRVTGRASWWRVVDAECAFPAVNSPSAVSALYTKGAKR